MFGATHMILNWTLPSLPKDKRREVEDNFILNNIDQLSPPVCTYTSIPLGLTLAVYQTSKSRPNDNLIKLTLHGEPGAQEERGTIHLRSSFISDISPIESLSVFKEGTSKKMIVCTEKFGVYIIDISHRLEYWNEDDKDIDRSVVCRHIKTFFKTCAASHDTLQIAAVTGLHNSVYVIDNIDEDKAFQSVSTYPECCDRLVWHQIKNTLLAYKSTHPSKLFIINTFNMSSQSISIPSHDYIEVHEALITSLLVFSGETRI